MPKVLNDKFSLSRPIFKREQLFFPHLLFGCLVIRYRRVARRLRSVRTELKIERKRYRTTKTLNTQRSIGNVISTARECVGTPISYPRMWTAVRIENTSESTIFRIPDQSAYHQEIVQP